jgi:glutathione S-transferase
MLILHHYPMSPFSEKIRLLCGALDLEWQSVIAPESPPRPMVDPLTGGYRRIPVAQVGADIFCDSRLICSELASAEGKPEFDPNLLDETARAQCARFEGELFWAAVTSVPARRILGELFRNLSFADALRFLRDRAGIARSARTRPVPPRKAVALFDQHLLELERMLAGGSRYLAGASPAYIDFAAVHTVWFRRVVGALPLPDGLPAVQGWYQRMVSSGHGRVCEGDAGSAFAVACEGKPRAVPAALTQDPRVGQEVVIQPTDYALDSTSGTLVGAGDDRFIVARHAADLGLLHVHFPVDGFQVAVR